MQETRRLILDILRARGQATVDEIVSELHQRRGDITAVTVRHHLARLQEESLIVSSDLRRKDTPGRPQHLYMLTQKAREGLPNNYQRLATSLLLTLQQHAPSSVNVILEGVADEWASAANLTDVPFHERMTMVVDYLNERGYQAYWQSQEGGYVLSTSNCPYHALVEGNHALCDMDMRLIAGLVGVVPRRLAHITQGDNTCSYFIPVAEPVS